MRLRFAALLLGLLASAASAQNVTVIGPVTPGNVPVFNSNTVIKDSGNLPGGACSGLFGAQQVCGSLAGGTAGPVNFSSFTGATGNVTWINVKNAPCNAVGNGVADDTAAINTCIAILNSAGKGVLYFPSGTYLTSSALTTITANSIIRGDGLTNLNADPGPAPPTPFATLIESNSSTASLFTFNTNLANTIEDISLYNISGTTPTAGAGITQMSPTSSGKLIINRTHIRGFYIDIDLQEAASGVFVLNTTAWDPVLYGIRIRNLVSADDGGWIINKSAVIPLTRVATSGIRWDGSGGGGSINDVHIVGGGPTKTFTTGIDLQGAGATVDIGIVNVSLENLGATYININGSIPNVWIVGAELGYCANGTTCVGIKAANTSQLTIANIIFPSVFTPPIQLTNCAQCYVTNINLNSLQSGGVYGAGGTFADHDATGGIGGGNYLPNTFPGTQNALNWSPAAGAGPTFQVNLNAGSPTLFSQFIANNDVGNQAVLGSIGSTNAFLPSGFNGLFGTTTGAVVMSDSSIGATGGTHDISLRAGGSAQEALLVQHNGHLNATGQNQTAPSLTAGCNGAGSSVVGSDAAGTVTGQTAAATTCTLTWGAAYANPPFCAVTGNSAPLTGGVTVGTTSVVVNFTSFANYKFSWICFGK